jgi:arginine:agmatine antiporter
VPFAAVALVGLFYVRSENMPGFNPSGDSLLAASAALAPLTMFAYLGLESATVPAGDVRDPRRTIPRSTIIGISVAAALYVLGTVVVFGVVPREQLMNSVAPFTDAARLMWGAGGAGAIAFAVVVSSIGALNGWTLMMGQVPMAAAQDRVFPPVFGRLSGRGVPAVGIVISAALATGMVAFEALGSPGVRAFYNLVISLSTMAAVIPYAFCALAVSLVAARAAGSAGVDAKIPRIGVVEIIAFVFSVFTVYGCGADAVLYGLLLLLLGIPVYVWQRQRNGTLSLTAG